MSSEQNGVKLAVQRLAALAHPTRLETFRMLMNVGPKGLRAGALSDHLGVAPNTMSAHFNVLTRANLVKKKRVGRTHIYSVNVQTTADLMKFLASDCCAGHPEIFTSLETEIGAERDPAIAH